MGEGVLMNEPVPVNPETERAIRRVVRTVLGGLTLAHAGTDNYDPIYLGRTLAIWYKDGHLPGTHRQVARIAATEYIGDREDTQYLGSSREVFKDILAGLEFRLKLLGVA
jgi:hypothetical protein